MRRWSIPWVTMLTVIVCVSATVFAAEAGPVYPGRQWETKTPEEAGLVAERLQAFSDYVGGFGCVVRPGYMVYTWGDGTSPLPDSIPRAGNVAAEMIPGQRTIGQS
jgi:hypothetical protein